MASGLHHLGSRNDHQPCSQAVPEMMSKTVNYKVGEFHIYRYSLSKNLKRCRLLAGRKCGILQNSDSVQIKQQKAHYISIYSPLNTIQLQTIQITNKYSLRILSILSVTMKIRCPSFHTRCIRIIRYKLLKSMPSIHEIQYLLMKCN